MPAQSNRRPLREGVDRNEVALNKLVRAIRRPLREGVDRNAPNCPYLAQRWPRRPLREGVDRNYAPARPGMI